VGISKSIDYAVWIGSFHVKCTYQPWITCLRACILLSALAAFRWKSTHQPWLVAEKCCPPSCHGVCFCLRSRSCTQNIVVIWNFLIFDLSSNLPTIVLKNPNWHFLKRSDFYFRTYSQILNGFLPKNGPNFHPGEQFGPNRFPYVTLSVCQKDKLGHFQTLHASSSPFIRTTWSSNLATGASVIHVKDQEL